MRNKIKTIGLIMFIIIGQITYGQSNKEKALEKGITAIQLMDNGNINESIKLLKEAQKLDPDRLAYPYELAYAHYLKEDYKKAIKILEKHINHKEVNERLFQLLGNSYDMIGKSEKAFEIYDKGLEKFPNSGMIHLEKGNVYWGKKEYIEALSFYEKGIEIDPAFPSNYYRAALIYCNSTEEVWGMIYGEIFMNLERNSKRTAEISKLLFDTYKKEIKFTSDTSFSVSFSKNALINITDLQDSGEIKLPFGIGIYEPTLMLAMINEKSIDLNSLDRIRTNFVEIYFKNGNDKKYPNILFEYQNEILKAGHLEAYNHWILMKGDEDAFDAWYSSNPEKWDNFVKWFTDNKLELDNSNKFYSGQY
ncbi:MAG TPA: tetratricopeptide repeat protein [Bacteroidales bacterium]|nr:tetratricopeptide repeat protein [Bacteroidales bacterium]HQB19060.1 tetratricopeptide repeat protein [Bacteroidales bacterium]